MKRVSFSYRTGNECECGSGGRCGWIDNGKGQSNRVFRAFETSIPISNISNYYFTYLAALSIGNARSKRNK